MGRLTQWAVIEGDIAVRRMSHDQKVRLADEIYAQQPNMLASILALPRMGVDMVQLEVALHILLVSFQAMKLSGHQWPLVTEDIQDGCLQRLTARARFNEGLPQELANKLVEQFHAEHAERYLLAFVYGYLGDHDLMGVRTEAEKYLMLGALNLVECVAFVGPSSPGNSSGARPLAKMGRLDAHGAGATWTATKAGAARMSMTSPERQQRRRCCALAVAPSCSTHWR